jgi:hypothetical protein
VPGGILGGQEPLQSWPSVVIDGSVNVEAQHLGTRSHPRGGVRQTRVRLVQQRAHGFDIENPAQLQTGHERWQHGATLRIIGGRSHLIWKFYPGK